MERRYWNPGSLFDIHSVRIAHPIFLLPFQRITFLIGRSRIVNVKRLCIFKPRTNVSTCCNHSGASFRYPIVLNIFASNSEFDLYKLQSATQICRKNVADMLATPMVVSLSIAEIVDS